MFRNAALRTPRKYGDQQLHVWHDPPVVPEVAGRPGEMGRLN